MNDTLLEAFDYQYTGTRQPLAGRRIRQNPARTMATLRELARIVSDEQSPLSDQLASLRGLARRNRGRSPVSYRHPRASRQTAAQQRQRIEARVDAIYVELRVWLATARQRQLDHDEGMALIDLIARRERLKRAIGR